MEQVEENKNIGEQAGGRRTERKIERIYQDGKKRLEDKEGYGKKKEGIKKDEGKKGKGTEKEGEGNEKVEEDGAENDDWRNRVKGKK